MQVANILVIGISIKEGEIFMKRKLIAISSIIFILFAVLIVGVFQYLRIDLKTDTAVTELGKQLSTEVSDYAKGNISSAQLDLSDVNTLKSGVYNGYITNKTQKLTFNVEVIDTTPPTADKIEGLLFLTNEIIKAESLVTNLEDYSKISIIFADGKESHSYSKGGAINETVILTDESGNENKISVNFMVIEDVTKPVLKGIKNITAYIGDDIDYFEGITAVDDRDGDISNIIEINMNDINLNTPGKYSILYLVKDSAGNETTKKVKITLLEDKSPILKGVANKTVYINDKVDFLKGVTAADDRDGDLTSKIKIDTSNVNINAAGIYKVIYSVTDSTKHKTINSITVTVKKKETGSANTNNSSSSSKDKSSSKANDSKPTTNKSEKSSGESGGFNFFDVPASGTSPNGDVPASGEHVGNWG